jgi:hypothetical protein
MISSARAALLRWKPRSLAIARIRWRVAAETPGCPFSANDTAALVTPARLAISAMVGRFISGILGGPTRELSPAA